MFLKNTNLYFLYLKSLKGANKAFLRFKPVEIFKPEGKLLFDDKCDGHQESENGYPIERGGEREPVVDDIHIRHSYQNQQALKLRDQEGVEKAISGKSGESYKSFYNFYSAFFTDPMLQIVKKTYENVKFWEPEVLHSIAKMFYRPSEKHYDIRNLAIAPKWVNSLMMVIECSVSWHVVQSPFAEFGLKTRFKTFPRSHVLREGNIEATLKTDEVKVTISKDLQPYQKCPSYSRLTDIMQATFVLNNLLNNKPSNPIDIQALLGEPSNPQTNLYNHQVKTTAITTLVATNTISQVTDGSTVSSNRI